jgi:alpha-L-fucosidase
MNVRKLEVFAWIAAVGLSIMSAGAADAEPLLPTAETPAQRDARLAWWREARFGLFIHWGPSSLSGKEISWSRIGHPHDHRGLESIPPEEYDHLYQRFNPVRFDADAWLRLAKEAGMKYVVFITKHHDGFSMWPTKLRPEYSISATPFPRDICKEIADAAHKHGLKLGWYYSTRDWTHPDYLVGDNRRYDAFYQGQVRELLSNYGRVDLVWFDHVAGNWRDYRFRELFEMMYRLQPGLLVNNRAAAFIRTPEDQPPPEIARLVRGDFDTPEQRIGTFQNDRPWESCMTLTECADGGGWSYRPDGRTRRFEECARMLVNCAAGDGNLLLNVGPLPTGEIAPDQQQVLRQMGDWLARYGESIYATRGGPFRNGEWGGATFRDKMIYLHFLKWSGNTQQFGPLKAKVLHATALTGGAPAVNQSSTGVTLVLPPDQQDKLDTILKLELDAPAAGEFIDGRPLNAPEAVVLRLDSPLDYQVFQRQTLTEGRVRVSGRAPAGTDKLEVQVRGDWQPLGFNREDGAFQADLSVPAGGWYVCRARAIGGGKLLATAEVPHVGVGEVFVVAGQSNAGNHGEQKLRPQTGLVAAFDGTRWQPADDPQPGASGDGGSFLSSFGDAIAERFKVPIGLVACGIGATSVREWLPPGTRFPNPPTLTGRVQRLPSGEWESKGEAFATFIARLKLLGPRGVRAVLWHQGESDANQQDPTRTLSGNLYRQYLERLIRDSRRELGWDAPWFVAQVSYHVPGDEASPEIRAAQKALWEAGVALEGPDTDALKGGLRESNGQGVHFSGQGLREHARLWVEKVAPWLEAQIPPAASLIITNFASAPFPHPQRANGHTYRGEFFPASPHYSDCRVALAIPAGFRAGSRVNFVVHIHGWRAALDELLEKFQLVDQFRASGRNAVLVVPQGPLRAPDSFGGKLEDSDGLRRLLTEALAVLRDRGVAGPADIGRVILSGHSGGYHAIAAMLDRGGLSDQVSEVYLFDGLYGETDKYLAWLKSGPGKLINIYTDDGGTKAESERMATALRPIGLSCRSCWEKDLDLTEWKSQRVLFVHSDLGHDGVLFERRQFCTFLKASVLEPLGSAKTSSRPWTDSASTSGLP